jgi:hypothetical protein
MIAQDVKVLCPAELRDTCILLFHHMQKAFSGITFGQQGPVRISTQKQQQQQQQAESAAGSSPRHSTMSDKLGPSLQKTSTGQGGISLFSNADASSAEGGPAGAGVSSSGMVTTLADEELLLQQILQENRAAAAAAAAASSVKPLQQHGSGDLATVSIGAPSVTAESVAGDVSVGVGAASLAREGSGHAAFAARAVRGHSRLGEASSHPEPESSGLSSCDMDMDQGLADTDSDSMAGAQAQQQQQQSAAPGGSGDEVLLEYEIEFQQVQVRSGVGLSWGW